jgi:hypothetical protein
MHIARNTQSGSTPKLWPHTQRSDTPRTHIVPNDEGPTRVCHLAVGVFAQNPVAAPARASLTAGVPNLGEVAARRHRRMLASSAAWRHPTTARWPTPPTGPPWWTSRRSPRWSRPPCAVTPLPTSCSSSGRGCSVGSSLWSLRRTISSWDGPTTRSTCLFLVSILMCAGAAEGVGLGNLGDHRVYRGQCWTLPCPIVGDRGHRLRSGNSSPGNLSDTALIDAWTSRRLGAADGAEG